VGENHTYVQEGGVSNRRDKRNGKRGIKTILQQSDKHMKRKSTGILGRLQNIFIVFSK